MIALGNSVTSIYAGFIVFGTLGVLAEVSSMTNFTSFYHLNMFQNNGVPVEDVISQGPGLTFQVYPEAITLMPVPPLFNFLFFLMLCLLAMSSIVGMWEPTVAAILDEFPNLRSRRSLIYIGSCFLGFLGGLSMCFPSGIFMFNIINDHTANTILYMSILELASVIFLYGIRNFMKNITEMKIWMPKILKYYWMISWGLITPLLVVSITIIGFTSRKLDQHEGYVYPDGAQVLGYLVELSPVMLVLLVAVYMVIDRWRRGEVSTLLCSDKWIPRDDSMTNAGGTDNKCCEK